MTDSSDVSISYQFNSLPIYQSQDNNNIQFFDNFFILPSMNFDNSITENSRNDDDINLIKLRAEKDEVLASLAKGQIELNRASEIYPNKIWSHHQICRIKQLNAKLQRENDILNNFNQQTGQFNTTDIYKDNITNSSNTINAINDMVTKYLPYLHH